MESDQEQREWQAFLYVADELSPREREAFELLLAEDQSAREAVAAAVALCDTISAVYRQQADQADGGIGRFREEPSEPRRRTSRRKRVGIGLGWAAAASLVLLAVGRLLPPPAERAGSLDELARAWSASLEEQPEAAWPIPEAATPDPVVPDSFHDEVASLETADGDPPGIPAWMLAGLAAFPEGEPSDREPEL